MRIANSQHDADMRRRWVELAWQWESLAKQVEDMRLGEVEGGIPPDEAADKLGK
jgi:hypothetical protein